MSHWKLKYCNFKIQLQQYLNVNNLFMFLCNHQQGVSPINQRQSMPLETLTHKLFNITLNDIIIFHI